MTIHGDPVVTRRGKLPVPGSAQRGFSLLEALVAFTVLALVLGALLEMFSTGLSAIERDREYTHALVLSQNLIAELVTEKPLAVGVSTGRVDDYYRWRSEITEFQDEHQLEHETLFEVTVTVNWNDGWRAREVSLTSLEMDTPK